MFYFSNLSYFCLVCLEKIRPKNATWHCDGECFQVFHIHCIKKWSKIARTNDGGWRCPGINIKFKYTLHFRCYKFDQIIVMPWLGQVLFLPKWPICHYFNFVLFVDVICQKQVIQKVQFWLVRYFQSLIYRKVGSCSWRDTI